MEQPQKLFAEYMRKISQLYKDFSDDRISREEAVARLDVLKTEHKQLVESGIFPLNKRIAFPVERGDDMIRRFSRTRKPSYTPHELDFKCQCKSCVSKHTITMADRDFLRELKISWGKTVAEEIAETNIKTPGI
jgi:hypothetical protein